MKPAMFEDTPRALQRDACHREGADESQEANRPNGPQALQILWSNEGQRQDDDEKVEPGVTEEITTARHQPRLHGEFARESEPDDPVQPARDRVNAQRARMII